MIVLTVELAPGRQLCSGGEEGGGYGGAPPPPFRLHLLARDDVLCCRLVHKGRLGAAAEGVPVLPRPPSHGLLCRKVVSTLAAPYFL